MFDLYEDTPIYDEKRWSLSAETMFFEVTVRNIQIHDLEALRDSIIKEIDKYNASK